MIGHMDIAGFDLNLMKAFDALYAERHVTRAGSRIGLSQSAMSGALTRLRELLGDELFVRTPSGMQPTPRAHDLAGPVSDALRLLRNALQADSFDPATADNTVTLAMTDYAAFVLLPPLMARLSVDAPAHQCARLRDVRTRRSYHAARQRRGEPCDRFPRRDVGAHYQQPAVF
jgi:DNA-binding transcriptional LysR family regulator